MINFFLKQTEHPSKQLIRTIILAYTIFSLIIVLVFIPTSILLSDTGYSTSNLQEATSPEEVDLILDAWSDVFPTIYFQCLGDYIFLFAGLIGNTTIFVLLGKYIKEKGNILFPFIGFLAVFFSRGFDALENTLTLIIIIFNDIYPHVILSILPIVPIIKFTFVALVYSLILLNFVYCLVLRRKS